MATLHRIQRELAWIRWRTEHLSERYSLTKDEAISAAVEEEIALSERTWYPAFARWLREHRT